MATLREARKRALKLNNLSKLLFTYIKKIEGNFTHLNKEQIFTASEDIFGNPLGYYSRGTEEITGGAKKEGEPFTGVDTGDFLKGFYIKVVGDKIMFGSSDSKVDIILKNARKKNGKGWLTDELFGLTDDNLQLIIDENILPYLQMTQRQILGI